MVNFSLVRTMRRFLPLAVLAAAIVMLVSGVVIGEHTMMFSYGVIICLSCMGIG